jgi:hypothetical protein
MGLWSTIRLGTTSVDGWSNIRVTKQLNRASMLTARIPLLTADAQGWTKRLDTTSEAVGHSYTDTGGWTGMVTNTTIRDGMLEITAQGELIRLKKKLLELPETQGTPGNILITALNYFNKIQSNLPLIFREVDQATGWVAIPQTYGIDIYDELLPALTDGCGMELREDNFVLTFKQTVGEDLSSSSVQLAAGFNSSACQVISAAVSNDLFTVTNEYRGVGLQRIVTRSAGAAGTQRSVSSRQKVAGGSKAISATAAAGSSVTWQQFRSLVYDATSIARWTQLAERRDYPNIRTSETMNNVLNREMAVSKNMYPTMELTLVNQDAVFSRMALGNTLRVNVAGFGLYKARVMATTLDVDSGTMTASMKVVEAL